MRFEVRDERQEGVAEGDDYGFGVALGAFGAGVGVVDGEEERGFFGAEGFEAVGFDGGHVGVEDVHVLCELCDLGVVAHVALDAGGAVGIGLPDVSDGEGHQDGRGVFGAGVGDVLAHVPAVGVDGLCGLAGEWAGGEGLGEWVVGGFVAEAFVAGAGLGVSLRSGGAAVVVAHLDEDVVAGLHLGEDVVPEAFVVVAAGAAAGAGSVGDVDFGGVEVVGDVVAPAEVGLVAGGGVADDEEGGEIGVEGSVPGDGGLGWGVGGGRGLGESGGDEEREPRSVEELRVGLGVGPEVWLEAVHGR